jgi:hypothetical protein
LKFDSQEIQRNYVNIWNYLLLDVSISINYFDSTMCNVRISQVLIVRFFSDIITQKLYVSRLECLVQCDEGDECHSVNYNAELYICEMTAHVPRLLQPSFVGDHNWKVYHNGK